MREAALNHLPPKLMRTYDKNNRSGKKREALGVETGQHPDAGAVLSGLYAKKPKRFHLARPAMN